MLLNRQKINKFFLLFLICLTSFIRAVEPLALLDENQVSILEITSDENKTDELDLTLANTFSTRLASTMALDSMSGNMILFGGLVNGVEQEDTWIWKEDNWIQLTPLNSPSARSGAVMACDESTGQLVLFGGFNGGNLGDTWTWTGNDWEQLTSIHSPSPRCGSSMGYDKKTGQLILFGGYGETNLNDTWNWIGTDWVKLSPVNAPSARISASLTFDAINEQLVLCGGMDIETQTALNDAWVWDGINWIELTSYSSSMEDNDHTLIAYDQAVGLAIPFDKNEETARNHKDFWDLVPSPKMQLPVPPTVSFISPNQGPTSGGTTVTLTGSNLTGATSVQFGGVPAANFSILSDTEMTTVSPAGTGSVNITVTNNFGTSTPNASNVFTYLAAPTVTSVSPNQGPATGGVTVTLTGTGFTGATSVQFGGVSATNINVNSDTSITATTPPGTGSVDVQVTTANGTATLASGFTYVPLPTVTSVSPNQGPVTGGTTVVITGANFIGATSVQFGGLFATSFTVNSPTQITAVSPAGTGIVNVTVTTPGGTSAAGNIFIYVALATVTSISPNQGSINGGTTVVLTGTNFSGATGVQFGGVTASFIVNSATQITAVSPAGTGSVNVTVTNGGGTSAAAPGNLFTYIVPPTVTSISPSQGPTAGGTTVTLTGSNFTGAVSVLFGSTPATSFTVNSATQITAVSPAGIGSVNVTVTTAGGASAVAPGNLFTYIFLPTVSFISPSQGPTAGGTTVTLTGSNFTGAVSVLFGSTPATSFTVNSATQITAVSPAGIGSVNVTVTTAGGTSAAASGNVFTYVAPPTVLAVSPNQGPVTGGTTVTLTGSNFTGTTSVLFGSTPATSFTVNSATQITAVSPAGIGSVNVTVTTAGGASAAASGNVFTYVAPPTVTAISPNQGPTSGGTTVTLIGTDFTGAVSVLFGSTPAVSFTVDSSTQITAVSPAEIAGNVNVTVTTVGGTSTIEPNNLFTYIGPPAVLTVSPNQGSINGGTTVTLIGANFTGATSVQFGNIPAISFTVDTDDQITAISPTGVGAVNIIVTTPSGISTATSSNLFNYVAPPTITSLSPNQGSINGGTLVRIMGSGFTNTTAVLFEDQAALSFTIVSDTQLDAIAPAQLTGTYTITIVTVFGDSTPNEASQFTYVAEGPVSTILPPEQVRGKQIKNRFATQTDLINVITWQAPSSGVTPVSYKIYRDSGLTQLAGVVNARQLLSFKDHQRRQRRLYVYYLVSIDTNNQQSIPVRLVLKGSN